ncbi:UbiD family decarboxylase [Nocardia sp. CDC159]|uniref:Pyrrole-2-carboxylic acid decarboxylase n=1 Tax=Nocardia pulmonis TaxID=2951408 RepID=A0A9X2E7E4_9NOCA|nr:MULTISPECIES: UbiD family decarboxylase [Nocardia]MCM6775487.1 UbiD family decarboxylase [Nocardia pulmonis]MCM6787779.1 UbiD family decarboxylase [Nocardia sp. CDC159]
MQRLRSLREYLARLQAMGDVREVTAPVDTKLEMGAIIRHSTENREPAPLFTNIRGYPKGFRVLGAPGALSSRPAAPWARMALSLGLDPDTPVDELIERVAAARDKPPVDPVVVDSGPCQQNVLTGDAVDLNIFPTPLIHDGDGGRYFQTWGSWVLRTPDGDWTNWSINRAMIHDARHLTGLISAGQHNGVIRDLWTRRGEPMPFALVQGAEPAVPLIAGMCLPERIDEGAFVGGWFGEPVEVVRCKTVDLYVPAEAEIIVEGHVLLDATLPEGPMGEYNGYLYGHAQPQPVYEVTAITYRDDPILPVVAAGKPIEDCHTVFAVVDSAEILYELRGAGFPVTRAWMVPETTGDTVVVTVPRDWRQRVDTDSATFCRSIADALIGTHVGNGLANTIVCDDDIDPTDPRDLLWALGSRCHPKNGHLLIESKPIVPLQVYYTAEELETLTGPSAIYDCLLSTDADRPRSTAFRDNYSDAVRQRALAIWNAAAN